MLPVMHHHPQVYHLPPAPPPGSVAVMPQAAGQQNLVFFSPQANLEASFNPIVAAPPPYAVPPSGGHHFIDLSAAAQQPQQQHQVQQHQHVFLPAGNPAHSNVVFILPLDPSQQLQQHSLVPVFNTNVVAPQPSMPFQPMQPSAAVFPSAPRPMPAAPPLPVPECEKAITPYALRGWFGSGFPATSETSSKPVGKIIDPASLHFATSAGTSVATPVHQSIHVMDQNAAMMMMTRKSSGLRTAINSDGGAEDFDAKFKASTTTVVTFLDSQDGVDDQDEDGERSSHVTDHQSVTPTTTTAPTFSAQGGPLFFAAGTSSVRPAVSPSSDLIYFAPAPPALAPGAPQVAHFADGTGTTIPVHLPLPDHASRRAQPQLPMKFNDESKIAQTFIDELRREKVDAVVSTRLMNLPPAHLTAVRHLLNSDAETVRTLCERERGKIVCTLLERFGTAGCPGMTQTLVQNFCELSSLQSGCNSLMRIMSHLQPSDIDAFANVCIANLVRLSCDRQANYMVKSFTKWATTRDDVMQRFIHAFLAIPNMITRVAADKYGSYVVEAFLKSVKYASVRPLIHHLFVHHAASVRVMCCDTHSHFVVRAALDNVCRHAIAFEVPLSDMERFLNNFRMMVGLQQTQYFSRVSSALTEMEKIFASQMANLMPQGSLVQ